MRADVHDPEACTSSNAVVECARGGARLTGHHDHHVRRVLVSEPAGDQIPSAGMRREDHRAGASSDDPFEVLAAGNDGPRPTRFGPLGRQRLREAVRVGHERPRDVQALGDPIATPSKKTEVSPNRLPFIRQCERERDTEHRRTVPDPQLGAVACPRIRETTETDSSDVHLMAANFRRMASRSTGPSPAMAFA